MTVLETREITVHDPRSGDLVSRVPVAAPRRCAEAVAATRSAAFGWSRTPAGERSAALHAAAETVRAAADELAGLTERETGKPFADARGGSMPPSRHLRSTRSWGRCTAAARCRAVGAPPT